VHVFAIVSVFQIISLFFSGKNFSFSILGSLVIEGFEGKRDNVLELGCRQTWVKFVLNVVLKGSFCCKKCD
jgi:hypothetical protein